MAEIESRLPIGQGVMDRLRSHKGKVVELTYLKGGERLSTSEPLRVVDDYFFVGVGSNPLVTDCVPFVGNGVAIQEVKGQEGETLYVNPLLADGLGPQTYQQADGMLREIFGAKVAAKVKSQRIKFS